MTLHYHVNKGVHPQEKPNNNYSKLKIIGI